MAGKGKAKGRGAGRPRIEFDMEVIRGLAEIQATDEEIAAVCACSVDTITRRKADDPDFAEAIKRGRDSGKSSLRRAQWTAALAGNVTMMIWLGKQHLDQADKAEHSGPGGGPISTRDETVDFTKLSPSTLRKVMEELGEL